MVTVIAWELPGFKNKYPKFKETVMQCECHAYDFTIFYCNFSMKLEVKNATIISLGL